MKHLWCWLALGCALICYVQRGLDDPRWFRYPIGFLLTATLLITMFAVMVIPIGYVADKVQRKLSQHGFWMLPD